jgi:PPOX class probable F420-dependent enzyme
MTPSRELDAFLSNHTRTMLVVLRADGSPTVYPMLGLWRDEALWFNTYRRSAKMRHLERDPRVCCVVLSGDDELHPPAIVLRGEAEIMEPGTMLPLGPSGVSDVARPAGVTDGVVTKVADRVASAKRVLIRVSPRELRMVT